MPARTVPLTDTADHCSPRTRTMPSGTKSLTATPSAQSREPGRCPAVATPRQAVPRHDAHACRDHEVSAQKRPEDRRRSPIDGHEHEPGSAKDTDQASHGMGVRSRVEADQRSENYQSEQDSSDDPHERLLSRLRHLHHTGARPRPPRWVQARGIVARGRISSANAGSEMAATSLAGRFRSSSPLLTGSEGWRCHVEVRFTGEDGRGSIKSKGQSPTKARGIALRNGQRRQASVGRPTASRSVRPSREMRRHGIGDPLPTRGAVLSALQERRPRGCVGRVSDQFPVPGLLELLALGPGVDGTRPSTLVPRLQS